MKLHIRVPIQQTFANLRRVAIIGFVVANLVNVLGQGTINFNNNQVAPHGTNYWELGMAFNVIIPTFGGGRYYDGMVIDPGFGSSNVPTNPTPYMFFIQQNSPDDYVAFSLTNGYSFGLTSVQLADPNSPSLVAVPIMFIGSLVNSSTVTNTFITPGNGANSLLNYQFTSAFASDLTSVSIFAPRWAMDNLVFTVPEPSAVLLILLGSGVFLYVRHRNKRH